MAGEVFGGVNPIQVILPAGKAAVQYKSMVLDYVLDLVPMANSAITPQIIPAKAAHLIVPIFFVGLTHRNAGVNGTTSTLRLRFGPSPVLAVPLTIMGNNVSAPFSNGAGVLDQFSASYDFANLQAGFIANTDYRNRPIMVENNVNTLATGCTGTVTLTVGYLEVLV
jgi:hypothetical protein